MMPQNIVAKLVHPEYNQQKIRVDMVLPITCSDEVISVSRNAEAPEETGWLASLIAGKLVKLPGVKSVKISNLEISAYLSLAVDGQEALQELNRVLFHILGIMPNSSYRSLRNATITMLRQVKASGVVDAPQVAVKMAAATGFESSQLLCRGAVMSVVYGGQIDDSLYDEPPSVRNTALPSLDEALDAFQKRMEERSAPLLQQISNHLLQRFTPGCATDIVIPLAWDGSDSAYIREHLRQTLLKGGWSVSFNRNAEGTRASISAKI